MPELKETSDWLRVSGVRQDVGVDRENAILRGFVVAQEGPFKSEGRGEFDLSALKKVVTLMNKQPKGLKSRFSHPSLSADGVGKYLGRVKGGKLDSVRVQRDGETVLLHAVRGDLHFNDTALEEPPGGGKPLGIYVMDLAESDPDAISSSLVLSKTEELRMDPKTKRPMMAENGDPLPPLWRPTALHASDVVDTGDAVDGILSAELSIEGLPDELVRRASELLSQAFPGASREVISARVDAWKASYLSWRFGDDEDVPVEAEEPSEHLLATLSRSVVEMRAILAARQALG
jgi:hypothetical protein